LTPAVAFGIMIEVSREKPLRIEKGVCGMSSFEEILEQSLLYDFYGELLTEHQQKIYEAAFFENYSLSEIAEDAGISRQGVHDLLRRCDKQLRAYEQKLHLVERFTKMRGDVEHIMDCVDKLEGVSPEKITEIKGIAGKLLEEL
jgi:predicted DNA-binding protein YlxM (UPF0122 family)